MCLNAGGEIERKQSNQTGKADSRVYRESERHVYGRFYRVII